MKCIISYLELVWMSVRFDIVEKWKKKQTRNTKLQQQRTKQKFI